MRDCEIAWGFEQLKCSCSWKAQHVHAETDDTVAMCLQRLARSSVAASQTPFSLPERYECLPRHRAFAKELGAFGCLRVACQQVEQEIIPPPFSGPMNKWPLLSEARAFLTISRASPSCPVRFVSPAQSVFRQTIPVCHGDRDACFSWPTQCEAYVGHLSPGGGTLGRDCRIEYPERVELRPVVGSPEPVNSGRPRVWKSKSSATRTTSKPASM